jgi:hypothetical protein
MILAGSYFFFGLGGFSAGFAFSAGGTPSTFGSASFGFRGASAGPSPFFSSFFAGFPGGGTGTAPGPGAAFISSALGEGTSATLSLGTSTEAPASALAVSGLASFLATGGLTSPFFLRLAFLHKSCFFFRGRGVGSGQLFFHHAWRMTVASPLLDHALFLERLI